MEGLHDLPGKTYGLGEYAHSPGRIVGLLCEAVRGKGSQE